MGYWCTIINNVVAKNLGTVSGIQVIDQTFTDVDK